MATAKKSIPEKLSPAEENRINAALALSKEQEKADEADKAKPKPESDAPDEVVVEHDTVAAPEQGPDVSPEGTLDSGAGNPPVIGDTVGVTEPEPPKKRSVRDRVRDAEARWEKDFDEILLDLHDHVFGASPPHEETTAKRQAESEPKE